MDPMHPDDEERCAAELAAYDAALATGQTQKFSFADPELRGAQHCLNLLAALWPRDTSAASHTTPVPADTINELPVRRLGRFQLVRELGRGGGGVVFLAEDPKLKRQVALKVPRSDWLFTPELRQRFVREATAAGQLDHPHIVRLYEAGEAGGVCYLVSAYCPGPNLATWLQQRGEPVPPRQAAQIVAALADGVEHMHRRGILHRDIKPGNVIMEPSGGPESKEQVVPRLTDFGLAKLEAGLVENDGRTRTGAILGTPAYMAPEQAEGRPGAIGPGVDVYALGAVLYELLTGRPPFSASSDMETLQQVLLTEPTPVRRHCRQAPRDLETICLKCLAKAPGKRYASAADLRDDLQRYLEGRPIRARPVGPVERANKWLARHKVLSGVSGLLLATLGVLLLLALRPTAAPLPAELDAESRRKIAEAERVHWEGRSRHYSVDMGEAWRHWTAGGRALLPELLRRHNPAAGERDLRSFEWHYLQRLSGLEAVLRGHAAPVDRIGFSSDGHWCVTASLAEKKLVFWDVGRMQRMRELPIQANAIEQLIISPDIKRLIIRSTIHKGGAIHTRFLAWDLAREKIDIDVSMARDPLLTALSPDGTQIAFVDNLQDQLLIQSLAESEARVVYTLPKGDLHRPTLLPGGTRAAIGRRNEDGTAGISVLDVITGVELAFIPMLRDSSHLARICCSADGNWLAAGMDQGRGLIWNLRDNTKISFEAAGHIAELAFNASASVLLVGSSPTEPINEHLQWRLLDVQTGRTVDDIRLSGFKTRHAEFSAAGLLALCCDDHLVRLYDWKTRSEAKLRPEAEFLAAPAPESEAWAVAFAPRGEALAVGYDHVKGDDAETLKLWEMNGKKAKLLTGHKGTVMALAYSPDGRTLATASYDAKVGLWNAADGKHLAWLKGHTDAVRAIAFSPDGRHLASGGSDGTIFFWDAHARCFLSGWNGHQAKIRSLAFAPGGKQLASAGNDKKVAIWNLANRTNLRILAHERNVTCLAYSPDGSLLVAGDEAKLIKIWDAATGELRRTIQGHTGKVRALAISPNGQTLASGGEDKAVRLWNLTTGDEMITLKTEDFINGLAFDREGKVLAAALHDGRVKVWSGSTRLP